MKEITDKLFSLQDLAYRDFQSKLMPTVDYERIIGVRTPDLRKLAAELYKSGNYSDFLNELPHYYYEENNLHAFLIEKIKDFGSCVAALDSFLPYVDNWATCDSLKPKALVKNREALTAKAYEYLNSNAVYTVRFGIGILMAHFLDDFFSPEYPQRVSKIISGEYYINMMIAWYFATGLAKQYESFIPYIEKHLLPPVVEKMTVQKARESFRVSDEHKEYLKSIRIK